MSNHPKTRLGFQRKIKPCPATAIYETPPYHITSVLASGQAKKQIGAYNFVNDAGKIREAVVMILYMLRCCIAHGDISPDESANEVYKYEKT